MFSHATLGPTRRWLILSVLFAIMGAAGPVFSAVVLKTTIPTGTAPSAVALNPLTGRAYVVNYFGGTTSVIDCASESRLATISSGIGLTVPNAVVVNSVATPPRAYVANFWSGALNVIDESSLTVTRTVSLGGHGGAAPRALAVDPSGTTPKLYVAEYGADAVSVWNAETYAFITRIPVGDAPRALGIFSSVSRKRIFVANRGSHTVSVIDGETDAVVATVPTGSAPKAIAVDTSTGWAWITNEAGNSVTAIDAADASAGTVGVGTKPAGLAIDPVAGRVFVANSGSGSVSVLRTADMSREATIAVGAGPWAVAFDAADAKAYVTCFAADAVSIIDAGLSVSSVGVGDGPYALAIDESSSPHKVFVANRSGNTLSILADDGLARMMASPSAAFAAAPAVANLTIEAVTADAATGSTVLEGTAASARAFPAALLGIWMRIDGSGDWLPATVLSGGGTATVRWRLVVPGLQAGTHSLSARVLDQTAAASSSSDGAGSDKGFSAGELVTMQFSSGVSLSEKRGMACASCHGTPDRGQRRRTPAPLERCPQIR